MSTEARIQSEILLRLGSRTDVCLWRNNVGVAVPLSGTAPQRYGQPGSADLLGLVTVRGVAVFLAVEVKSARGKLRDEQARWLQAMALRGAICIVARSADEAALELAAGIREAERRMGP